MSIPPRDLLRAAVALRGLDRAGLRRATARLRRTIPRPNDRQLEAYGDAAWLIQRHAVTVTASVSSLKALRVRAKGGRAKKPLVGFDDPVFGPPPGSAEPRRMAVRAAAPMRSQGSYWHGARADLKAVARWLGAAESDVKLGPAGGGSVTSRWKGRPVRTPDATVSRACWPSIRSATGPSRVA